MRETNCGVERETESTRETASAPGPHNETPNPPIQGTLHSNGSRREAEASILDPKPTLSTHQRIQILVRPHVPRSRKTEFPVRLSLSMPSSLSVSLSLDAANCWNGKRKPQIEFATSLAKQKTEVSVGEIQCIQVRHMG